jgi:4-hydroxy-4-methyl-2-oxoglutarate aldolase
MSTDAATLLALGSATLGESGARACLPRLKAVWKGARLAAPAYTADCPDGDNLALHVAVVRAPAGSVLVGRAAMHLGNWGEVLTTGAEARGLAGLVLDGGVRDVDALEAHRWPVFASAVALPGAVKVGPGVVGGPITVAGAYVETGDWIVADADGVCVIPHAVHDAVVAAAQVRADKEAGLFTALRGGATTIELLGLDAAGVHDAGRVGAEGLDAAR